jgi:hypothetical protein
VELAVKIVGGRINTLLGSSRAIDECGHDQYCRDPMERLGDGPIAWKTALFHSTDLKIISVLKSNEVPGSAN